MKFKWIIVTFVCLSVTGCGFLEQSSSENSSPIETNDPSENVGDTADGDTNGEDKTQDTPAVEPEKNDQTDDGKNESNGDEVIEKDPVEIPSKDTEQSDAPSKNPGKKEEEQPDEDEPAIPTVANPTSITVMVNKTVKLPNGYRPNDLTRPNVSFVFGNQKLEKALLRQEAATALKNMFTAAKDEGITLIAVSGYRSYETQAMLFENEVEQFGYEKASMAVAYPGTSEHQTGLTMDISAASVNNALTESFGKTAEGQWLENNAHKFGFILRYPLGKESITGYQYEPWHFRYIGVEIATEIYQNDQTLEEYYKQKQGI